MISNSPRSPLTDDLPPLDDRFFDVVRLDPGNLVWIGDELGAQTFAIEDDQVTYAVRCGTGLQRWRGHLGACGLRPC